MVNTIEAPLVTLLMRGGRETWVLSMVQTARDRQRQVLLARTRKPVLGKVVQVNNQRSGRAIQHDKLRETGWESSSATFSLVQASETSSISICTFILTKSVNKKNRIRRDWCWEVVGSVRECAESVFIQKSGNFYSSSFLPILFFVGRLLFLLRKEGLCSGSVESTTWLGVL